MNFEEAKRRYHDDKAFHQAVDMMYLALDQLALAPSDLREAAMFAAIKFESERLRPTFFVPTPQQGGEDA